MASKRGKTNFAIPINGTLAESIEKLNGELRRILVEDIRTALEGRVVVLLKAKPDKPSPKGDEPPLSYRLYLLKAKSWKSSA